MAAFTCLADRSVLTLEGPDRVKFLNALITNTIPETGLGYAALLTPQGRILTDLFIQSEPDRLLIDCDVNSTGELMQLLSRYRLRSAVTITDDGLDYAAYAFDHPFAGASVDPRLPALGWRAILPRIRLVETELEDMTKAYELLRIKLGVPRGLIDMPSKQALPLECNLDHLNGISFTKGCFPGQEITTRMHHRRLHRRLLLPVQIETGDSLPTGTPILSGSGIEEGEIRSVCDDHALAFLRIEAVGELITANSQPVRVLWPDWLPNEGTG